MDGRKRFVKDLSRFQSASVDGPLVEVMMHFYILFFVIVLLLLREIFGSLLVI